MQTTKTHIGEALRLYLSIKKLSAKELSLFLGMSPSTISRFVNGKSISNQNFLTLLQWFTSEYVEAPTTETKAQN